MKVTRLKKGYAIRLSDREFDVLGSMASQIEAGDIYEGFLVNLEPQTQAAYTRRVRRTDGFFLLVDEDRR